MNSEQVTAAREYLAPEGKTFWSWSADGQWVVWTDTDRAIAHRQEVEAVLSRLSGRGFPSFGAVVILLAACREHWKDALKPQGPFACFVKHIGAERDLSALPLLDLPQRLTRVTDLPEVLRHTAAAKALLAESFFETCAFRRPMTDDEDILSALREGLPHGVLHSQYDLWLPLDLLLDDLKTLEDGLGRLDPEALALRAKTGLESLPGKAPPLAELDSPQVRRLLSELRGDPELAGVVRLALDLLAAVHVPCRVSSLQELPVGGVSDISTRGSLDRLLLSELAHDSLTLSARVALNEALYLRREAPPRTPKGGRLILIDGSLRLWGLPRLFATAVGLSLAADTTPEFKLRILRLEGDEIRTVNLGHRNGLIEHLQALCPSPFPRVAWQKAEQEWREMEATQDTTEVVLVTHPDVLSDPDVRPFLVPFRAVGVLTACVQRDGRLQLSHLGPHGQEVLRTASLDLSAIGGPPDKERLRAPLLDAEAETDLPAIFHVRPFPLFLPYSHKIDQIRPCLAGGAVSYTKDGRLLLWSKFRRGGQELSRGVQRGRVCWLGDEGQLVCILTVIQDGQKLAYLAVDLETGNELNVELKVDQQPKKVFVYRGVLFLVIRNLVEAYDCRTAQFLDRKELPGCSNYPPIGRVLYAQGGWYAISFDGQSIRMDPVKLPAGCRDVMQFFDRDGLDGPWVISMDGHIFSTVTGEEVRCNDVKAPKEAEISRDGHRLFLSQDSGNSYIFDLRTSTATRAYNASALHDYTGWAYSLMKHIHDIGFDTQRKLLLTSGKKSPLFLLREGAKDAHGNKQLLFECMNRASAKPSASCDQQVFKQSQSPKGTRLAWKTARWDNGSQAFMDGRGLLHFKSSETSVPELTLVLSPDTPAAWTSDGKSCGSAFYLGAAGTVSADYILEIIRRFAERLR